MTWDKTAGEKEEKEEKGGEEAAEEGQEGRSTNYSFSFFHVLLGLDVHRHAAHELGQRRGR